MFGDECICPALRYAAAMQSFTGIVQRGSRRATALGYPTVNLNYSDKEVSGVYVARVLLKDEAPYMAAAFADPVRGVLEAYMLDFEDDLYGLEATIELHKKLREIRQFDSDEELKAAIAKDVAVVRECLHL